MLRRDAPFEHRDLAFHGTGRGDGVFLAQFRCTDRVAAPAVLCRGTRRVDGRVQVVGSGLKCCPLSNCVFARLLEPLDAPLERPQRQGHPFTVQYVSVHSGCAYFGLQIANRPKTLCAIVGRLKRSDPGLWGLHERGTIGP